jgi:hypothetical protein
MGSCAPFLVRGSFHLYLLHFSTMEVHHHHRLPNPDGDRQGKLAIQEIVNLESKQRRD